MARLKIIAVLDLQGGVVVRGVGGRRQDYRPVVSRLTPSCFPVTVADAIRGAYGLGELYLADLDAIAGAPPALPVYEDLRRCGFSLQVDAGVRDAASARPLLACGVEGVVVGLETVQGPGVLAELCRQAPERVIFSLDLKGGVPLGNVAAWPRPDAWSIAAEAVAVGVRRLLVLDLVRVGGGEGTGTEPLCRRLAKAFPNVEVSAGGGVRGADDLRRLKACGVCGVLVASALHDGRLRPEDLAAL